MPGAPGAHLVAGALRAAAFSSFFLFLRLLLLNSSAVRKLLRGLSSLLLAGLLEAPPRLGSPSGLDLWVASRDPRRRRSLLRAARRPHDRCGLLRVGVVGSSGAWPDCGRGLVGPREAGLWGSKAGEEHCGGVAWSCLGRGRKAGQIQVPPPRAGPEFEAGVLARPLPGFPEGARPALQGSATPSSPSISRPPERLPICIRPHPSPPGAPQSGPHPRRFTPRSGLGAPSPRRRTSLSLSPFLPGPDPRLRPRRPRHRGRVRSPLFPQPALTRSARAPRLLLDRWLGKRREAARPPPQQPGSGGGQQVQQLSGSRERPARPARGPGTGPSRPHRLRPRRARVATSHSAAGAPGPVPRRARHLAATAHRLPDAWIPSPQRKIGMEMGASPR